MNTNVWEGKKVRLRAIEPADWELFHQNDLDSEAARLCDIIYPPRSPDGTRLMTERAATKEPHGDNLWLAIENHAGEMVGSLNTQSCDPRHGTFKYGLAIFRNHWRKGYASDAILIILRYYFEELRYQKVTATVYSFNQSSIALHQRLGFQQEGRLQSMIFSQGEYHDELVYGLTRAQYALNRKKNKKKQSMPHTRETLVHDLHQLGLEKGMTVIVHSSLKSIGYVSGGPVAVIQALMDVITPKGTIVMPLHTADYSDPGKWVNPPVPKEWWPVIRKHMPAFEPAITPSDGMGVIAETFRNWPGVLRSSHPAVSFGAWGQEAEQITKEHSLDNCLGENSPLARIYDLNGSVLLLGVGFANNTSFHLAEYRASGAKATKEGAPIIEQGKRVWKSYEDIDIDSDCFEELGAEFQKSKPVSIGKVGMAESRLFQQREAVDFAQSWIADRRTHEDHN
jgi:aminoglycoside 3-N-acetyltransferase